MRTEHLEYLVDIYETKSFSKTADNFLTSHQVISKAMTNLENELDVQIFKRAYNGVSLTDIGVVVFLYAKEMLLSREKMLKTIADNRADNLRGKLNIYIAPRFANEFFLDFYNDYAKKNSKLEMILQNISYNFILNTDIDDDTIILVPMAESTLNDESYLEIIKKKKLVQEVLLEQTLGYCVSQKSPYYEQVLSTSKLPEDKWGDFPVIIHNYFIESSLQQINIGTNCYVVDNFDIQRKMIKSGSHVAFMIPFEYNWLFKNDEHIEFISKLTESKFYYMALYAPELVQKKQGRDFLDKLKAKLNEKH